MVPVGRRSSGYRSYRGSRGRRVSTSAAGHQRVRQGDVILTTVDTAAAWRVEKPITLAAIAAFVAFGLAGCGTSNNLLGSTETPTKVATPGAPPAATPQAKVAIAPVIGAPDAIAKQLQSQLGTALDQKGIGTVKTTDKAESALRGYIVSAREKAGTKVSYIWDVTDPAGKRVNRITGEELVAGAPGKDPWASVNAQLTQSIADKTAGSLATWLPSHKSAAVASSGATGTASAGAQAAPSTIAVASTDPAAASARCRRSGQRGDGEHRPRRRRERRRARRLGRPGDGDTSLAGAPSASCRAAGSRLPTSRPDRPTASRARSRWARARTASSRSRSTGTSRIRRARSSAPSRRRTRSRKARSTAPGARPRMPPPRPPRRASSSSCRRPRRSIDDSWWRPLGRSSHCLPSRAGPFTRPGPLARSPSAHCRGAWPHAIRRP